MRLSDMSDDALEKARKLYAAFMLLPKSNQRDRLRLRAVSSELRWRKLDPVRRARLPEKHCVGCHSTADPDELVFLEKHFFCRACLTCPHGHEHYRNGAADVCYECVRDAFTMHTLRGPLIEDIDTYYDAFVKHGWNVDEAKLWNIREQDHFFGIVIGAAVANPKRRAAPQVASWLPPFLWPNKDPP